MPNFIQLAQICNISHPNKLVFVFKGYPKDSLNILCSVITAVAKHSGI